MTKNEFLEGLRKALGNDLDRETVSHKTPAMHCKISL